jgi:tellurium resistance protein TerD
MAISLQKGQKFDLTKKNPNLKKIFVGLGWDVNKYYGGHSFDLDASIFLLGESGKITSEKDLIFYNNLQGGNGSVVHQGDNLTGEGDGDDEKVNVELNKIPSNIHRISFVVTIHEANERRQNFGQVSNAFIRVVNQETAEELVRYDLSEEFSIETGIILGELYRYGTDWKFSAVGGGFAGGLASICRHFGVDVE